MCQENVGSQGPGSLALSVCGGNLSAGTSATLLLSGAIPNDIVYLAASLTNDQVSILGGTAVSTNPFLIMPVNTDASGEFQMPNVPGGLNATIYVQAFQVDGTILPNFLAFSNIVKIVFLP